MRRPIVARAPGKLFLLGEYAVLDGCPAIVAAVNRYVQASLRFDPHRGLFRVESPDLGAGLEVSPEDLPPAEGVFRFVLAVLHELPRPARRQLLAGATLRITSELAGTPSGKPGLGGSAAVCVTIAAALVHALDGTPVDTAHHPRIFAWAYRAHRMAQKGLGSGADVAASTYGGVIDFEPADGIVPRVARLDWPPELRLLVAQTKDSASTPALIRAYLGLGNGQRGIRERFTQQTHQAVIAFRQARHLEALAIAADALQQLAKLASLPILTADLQTLIGAAQRLGAVAKSSGAGGGDCGLALAPSALVADRLWSAWESAGLFPLDLQIAPQGVVTHET